MISQADITFHTHTVYGEKGTYKSCEIETQNSTTLDSSIYIRYIIIHVDRWWEKYPSKRSLSLPCSWRDGLTGLGKCLCRRPIFRVREKVGAQNQSTYLIETHLEKLLFALYYLNSTYSFYFYCVSITSFRNEAFVVWMLFQHLKLDALQRIIFKI